MWGYFPWDISFYVLFCSVLEFGPVPTSVLRYFTNRSKAVRERVCFPRLDASRRRRRRRRPVVDPLGSTRASQSYLEIL